jgi:hypothetical protein
MTVFDDGFDPGPPPAYMDDVPPWDMGPTPAARPGAADGYVLEDFDTLEPGDQAWCVKYLLPTVGLAILYGPSGGGKSFFMIDILRRICRGEPVLGRRSYPAGVIYLAAEGAQGVRKRIKGARDRYGELGGRFLLLAGQPNLTDNESVAVLTGQVLKGRATLKESGHELRIIVVDTLAAASPGVDENTAASMGAVLGELQSLAVDLRCLVFVVTHTGKDESRGIRGWGGQFANADAVISLTEPNGELRVGTVMKVKDGPSGDRFAFALEVVELGVDDDGDPITTCVCVEREAPAVADNVIRPVTKSGGTARLIMQAFGRVLEESPQPVMAKGANGAKGVKEAELREMAYKIGVGPVSPEIPDGADSKERAKLLAAWRKQRGADYARGRDVLLSERKLRAEDGIVWEIDAKKVIR